MVVSLMRWSIQPSNRLAVNKAEAHPPRRSMRSGTGGAAMCAGAPFESEQPGTAPSEAASSGSSRPLRRAWCGDGRRWSARTHG